jgi:DNA-binding beta-propeller fold protein YncE
MSNRQRLRKKIRRDPTLRQAQHSSHTDKTMKIFYFKLAVLGLSILQQIAFAGPDAIYLGASTVPLDNPHDIKLSSDGELLYVSDVGNNRVAILNAETLAMVSSFGSDLLSGPHDIDTDAEQRLYVADTHNNRILIYQLTDGEPAMVGELTEGIRGPEGVLAHSNDRVYVGGAWSGNVIAYQQGKIVAELTGLSSPHDLEQTPEGNIWLADAGNNRMLLMTEELKVIKELKGSPYNFNGVRYQDVLPDGTLIAADKYSHSIKVISPEGDLLMTIGSDEPGMGPGVFHTPEGVETRANIIWLSDSGNNRIVKYRLDWD